MSNYSTVFLLDFYISEIKERIFVVYINNYKNV